MAPVSAALQWKDKEGRVSPQAHRCRHAATRCGFTRQAAEQHPAVRSLRPGPAECHGGESCKQTRGGDTNGRGQKAVTEIQMITVHVCISTHIHSLFTCVLRSKPE